MGPSVGRPGPPPLGPLPSLRSGFRGMLAPVGPRSVPAGAFFRPGSVPPGAAAPSLRSGRGSGSVRCRFPCLGLPPPALARRSGGRSPRRGGLRPARFAFWRPCFALPPKAPAPRCVARAALCSLRGGLCRVAAPCCAPCCPSRPARRAPGPPLAAACAAAACRPCPRSSRPGALPGGVPPPSGVQPLPGAWGLVLRGCGRAAPSGRSRPTRGPGWCLSVISAWGRRSARGERGENASEPLDKLQKRGYIVLVASTYKADQPRPNKTPNPAQWGGSRRAVWRTKNGSNPPRRC